MKFNHNKLNFPLSALSNDQAPKLLESYQQKVNQLEMLRGSLIGYFSQAEMTVKDFYARTQYARANYDMNTYTKYKSLSSKRPLQKTIDDFKIFSDEEKRTVGASEETLTELLIRHEGHLELRNNLCHAVSFFELDKTTGEIEAFLYSYRNDTKTRINFKDLKAISSEIHHLTQCYKWLHDEIFLNIPMPK